MVDNKAALLALRNRLLSVSGIPDANNRAFTNKDFVPTTGTPYIDEEYVPAPADGVTIQADGGIDEARGLYVVKWYGIQKTGITAIYAGVDAILAKFSRGTRITTSTGDTLRVSSKPRPWASQIIPAGDGFAVCVVKIPFWYLTSNAIAA